MNQLYGLMDLATALGKRRTWTWHQVRDAQAAHQAGLPARPYLLPHAYLQKADRQEVLFSGEQIAAARASIQTDCTR